MRRFPIAVVCVASMLASRPAEAGWREILSPSKNWQRIKNCCSSSKAKVENYCQAKVDKARSDQEKLWGLKVPGDLRADRPLVIFIHGLDSNNGVWSEMAKLVEGQGQQVGYFAYPDDGPIQDAADRLSREMAKLHATCPTLRVSLIGHSMGGLVARAYVEGEAYVHPVERLIAIAPLNHGSPWTRERFLLEAHEQFWNWRLYPEWSPLWMFTDGNGEASDDLKPGSKFLTTLNARPRRAGVRYTIVAGNQNILAPFGANAAASAEHCFSKNVWGMRQCRDGLAAASFKLANQTGESDGVVPLASVALEGVSDLVVLHGDHNTLAMGSHGRPPVAWETVRARLGQ